MKSRTLIVMGVLLGVMTSCGGSKENQEKAISTVKVERAVSGEQSNKLQYPGKVVPSTDANLSFKVAGTLKRVFVDVGDHVKAGQLLAVMDDSDYKVQLDATKAEYAQIKADAERVMALYDEGGTTASNYDKARYGLEQIEAKLKNHTNQLAYTRIYAPFSGYVQDKFFDSNETVAAGMPVLSLLGTGALEVEINLPATSYVHRADFCDYNCTLDVIPGQKLPLRQISILPQANSNQLYTMRLRFTQADARIAPGMATWVTITTCDSTKTVVDVPSTALLQEDDHSYVYRYDEGTGSVKKVGVNIEKLRTNGMATIEGDVKVGDQVVTSGVHHISDGEKVRLLVPVSKTNVGGLL